MEFLASPIVTHSIIFIVGIGAGWALTINIQNNTNETRQEKSRVGGDQVGRDKKTTS